MFLKKFTISSLLLILSILYLSASTNVMDSLMQSLNETVSIEEQINTKIEIATIYRKLNIDSLKKYGYSALNDSKKIGDKPLQLKSYFTLAAGYSNKYITDITDTVWMYIDSAEYVAHEISDKHAIAKADFFRGSVHLFQNNFQESVKYLAKADKEFSQLNDTLNIAQVKQVISHYYAIAKNYPKALEYALEYKELVDKLNLFEEKIYSLNNLGAIYHCLKDTTNEINSINECYRLSMQYGQPDDQIRATEDLARLYYMLSQLDSAEFYYLKTIKFATYPGAERVLGETYTNLSRVYFRYGQFDLTKKYLLKALYIEKQTNDIKSILFNLNKLSQLYDTLGNYKKSLEYLQEYNQLKDSIKLTEASYLLDKALSDNELSERIEELQRLKSQQATMVKKNLLVGFVALFSLIIFYGFWYYQRRLFYHVKKSTSLKNQDETFINLWNCNFPRKEPKSWQLLSVSLLLAGFIFGFTFFLFRGNNNLYLQTGASVLSGFLFYLGYRGVELFQKRIKDITQKRELLQSLIANLLFVIAISSIILSLNQFEFSLSNFLLIALATVTTCFLSLLILGILSFRSNYDLLFGNLFEEINRQLVAKTISKKQSENIIKSKSNSIVIEDENILLEDLLYIVSDNVYQEFKYLKEGKVEKKLTRKTLSTIEKELESYPNFVRCHRSYIINSEKILEVRGNSRQQFLIIDITNEKIPLSRTQAPQILSMLETANMN